MGKHRKQSEWAFFLYPPMPAPAQNTQSLPAPKNGNSRLMRVNVRLSDLLYIYIFGALLIAVSVSVASITVIQMKPRKILSQMD